MPENQCRLLDASLYIGQSKMPVVLDPLGTPEGDGTCSIVEIEERAPVDRPVGVAHRAAFRRQRVCKGLLGDATGPGRIVETGQTVVGLTGHTRIPAGDAEGTADGLESFPNLRGPLFPKSRFGRQPFQTTLNRTACVSVIR